MLQQRWAVVNVPSVRSTSDAEQLDFSYCLKVCSVISVFVEQQEDWFCDSEAPPSNHGSGPEACSTPVEADLRCKRPEVVARGMQRGSWEQCC